MCERRKGSDSVIKGAIQIALWEVMFWELDPYEG